VLRYQRVGLPGNVLTVTLGWFSNLPLGDRRELDAVRDQLRPVVRAVAGREVVAGLQVGLCVADEQSVVECHEKGLMPDGP